MTINKCPKCGEQYDETASFCSNCGIRFGSLYRCSECGALLTDDLKACPECGCPIEEEQNSFSIQAGALVCEECGEPLIGTETVCGNCGAPVGSIEKPVPTETAVVCAPAQEVSPADNIETAENSAAEKARKRISVYNIIALLITIPSTILFSGQLFTLNTGIIKVSSFSFLDFSDTFQFVSNILNLMKGFDEGLLDIPRDLTAFLGCTNYFFYAFLIFVIYHFIKGLVYANKGKLLTTVCCIPVILLGWCIFFSFVINSVILAPINELIDSTLGGLVKSLADIHGIICVGYERNFNYLTLIAIFNICAFALIKTIEEHVTKAHQQKK